MTVLIPCHNAADTIVGCLESVRDMADEILVADFGSTDDTLERVREFGGCRIIERSSPAKSSHPSRRRRRLRELGREPGQARLDSATATRRTTQRRAQPAGAGLAGDRARAKTASKSLAPSTCTASGCDSATSAASRRFDLFRKEAAQFELRDGRVEVSIPSGKIGSMKSRLVYEACPSIERCVRDMMRRATRAAETAHRKGRRASRRDVGLASATELLAIVRAALGLARRLGRPARQLPRGAGRLFARSDSQRNRAARASQRRSLVHDQLEATQSLYAGRTSRVNAEASTSQPIRSAA